VHISFGGDEGEAVKWFGFAKKQLRIMKDYMKSRNILVRSKTLPPIAGITIFIGSSFGVDTIRIVAKPQGPAQSLWITDFLPAYNYLAGSKAFNPQIVGGLLNYDTNGNFIQYGTSPEAGPPLFGPPSLRVPPTDRIPPAYWGLMGVNADAQNNLYLTSYSSVYKATPTGQIQSEYLNTFLNYGLQKIAVSSTNIYFIKDNTFFALCPLSQIAGSSVTFYQENLDGATKVTSLDYYQGVLYVSWLFSTYTKVAIHNANTGAFKSWLWSSTSVGSLQDIFVWQNPLTKTLYLYGTDVTNAQIVVFNFATGKIKNYPIGIPVLKIGQTYQGITAYIGDTTPYVPCGIVVDSVGNIYFTAVPYASIGVTYIYGPAKLIKWKPNFEVVAVWGNQVPLINYATQQYVDSTQYAPFIFISPLYMCIQGRT